MFVLPLFFKIFATIGIATSACVILVANSVYGVLFLILTFLNTGCLLSLLGLELIATLLILVYVGAILILFLFVIMMLEVPVGVFYKNSYLTLNAFVLLGMGLLFNAMYTYVFFDFFLPTSALLKLNWFLLSSRKLTVHIFDILYTKFVFVFLLVGLILLLAVVGSLVLALNIHKKSKAQVIVEQVQMKPSQSLFYYK